MRETEPRPIHINKAQAVWRETVRKILRYPLLKTQESADNLGGLERLCEFIAQGKGGIVVETHFSTSDPLWALDSVMVNQAKDVKASAPIAKHHAFFGLLPFAKSIGVRAIKVTTPETKRLADEKGENNLRRGNGTLEYMNEAAETVKDGGIVVIATNAHRKSQLTFDESGVVTRLIKGLHERGISLSDAWIHFVSFEMNGIQDYENKKVRGLNFFKKHKVNHGETLTVSELLLKAGIEIKESETRDEWKERALGSIENAVYNRFVNIVPTAYLPR